MYYALATIVQGSFISDKVRLQSAYTITHLGRITVLDLPGGFMMGLVILQCLHSTALRSCVDEAAPITHYSLPFLGFPGPI